MSLKRSLEAYDEAALATLANKGLVRRAKKDLERGVVEEVSIVEEEARVALDGQTVTLDVRGPGHARCSCPAAGSCRHILAAVLCLRERFASETGGEETAGEGQLALELLAHPLEAVVKWAGVRAMKSAARMARLDVSEIEEGASVHVTFRDGREVRFLEGAGLDDALYKGASSRRVASVASALLALRARHGLAVPGADGPEALPMVSGALRSRAECVATARERCARLMELGLGRRSDTSTDGLMTLSLSCVAANLPRLAGALRECARELHRLGARQPDADSARAFDRIAAADALARALDVDTPRADLIGVHRSEYHPLGDVELMGLGAWRFASSRGYRGVTVAFFCPGDGRVRTWSDARPQGVDPAFDPDARYRGAALWAGLGPPAQACRQRFSLRDAHGNEDGRLGVRGGTAAGAVRDSSPFEVELGDRGHGSWASLRSAVARHVPLGLRRAAANDALYVLRAVALEAVRFDEIQQAMLADLVDAEGDALTLHLSHDPTHERAVRWLASKALSSFQGRMSWLARVQPYGGALRATPLAVWLEDGPARLINLHLDETPAEKLQLPAWRLWRQASKAGTRTRRLLVDGADRELSPPPAWSDETERAVDWLEDETLAAAESGVATRRDPGRLEASIGELRRRGLTRLAEQGERWRTGRTAPELLALRWSIVVYRQAALRVALAD